MKNKKKIRETVFSLFSGAWSYFCMVSFHGEDSGIDLGKCQKKRIIAISSRQVICVIFFIWGESRLLYIICCIPADQAEKRKRFLISVGFFSAITPSASGGRRCRCSRSEKERFRSRYPPGSTDDRNHYLQPYW